MPEAVQYPEGPYDGALRPGDVLHEEITAANGLGNFGIDLALPTAAWVQTAKGANTPAATATKTPWTPRLGGHTRKMSPSSTGKPVRPMLAALGHPPTGECWAFESKWDGVRVVGVAVAARRPVGGRKNLVDVFGGTEHEAVRAGTRWAVGVLAAEGISASEQPLAALRELRRANRALSLTGAKVLLDQLLPPR